MSSRLQATMKSPTPAASNSINQQFSLAQPMNSARQLDNFTLAIGEKVKKQKQRQGQLFTSYEKMRGNRKSVHEPGQGYSGSVLNSPKFSSMLNDDSLASTMIGGHGFQGQTSQFFNERRLNQAGKRGSLDQRISSGNQSVILNVTATDLQNSSEPTLLDSSKRSLMIASHMKSILGPSKIHTTSQSLNKNSGMLSVRGSGGSLEVQKDNMYGNMQDIIIASADYTIGKGAFNINNEQQIPLREQQDQNQKQLSQNPQQFLQNSKNCNQDTLKLQKLHMTGSTLISSNAVAVDSKLHIKYQAEKKKTVKSRINQLLVQGSNEKTEQSTLNQIQLDTPDLSMMHLKTFSGAPFNESKFDITLINDSFSFERSKDNTTSVTKQLQPPKPHTNINLHEFKDNIMQREEQYIQEQKIKDQPKQMTTQIDQQVDITPEVASKVVKNYLLPMFHKKRRTQNSLNQTFSHQSSLDYGILTQRLSQPLSKSKFADPSSQNPSYVLSELQLNQDLYHKLLSTEQTLQETLEKLEASQQANRLLAKQIEELRKKFETMRTERKKFKNTLKDKEKIIKNVLINLDQLTCQKQEAINMFMTSDQQRVQCFTKMTDIMMLNDQKKNEWESSIVRSQLQQIEQSFVKDQLKIIYDSFSTMTSTKLLTDSYDFKIQQLETKLSEVQTQSNQQEHHLIQKGIQNDLLIRQLKEFKDLYHETTKRKDLIIHELREQNIQLSDTNTTQENDLRKIKQKYTETEANLKMAIAEVMGLRKRQEKMKFMSIKVFNQKICRNCLKEYNDKENYNWSCRTHQGEYGGVIWWCCGRKNKDDPGCKFGQHEPKDEGEQIRKTGHHGVDLVNILSDNQSQKENDSIRCLCCKKLGHNMANCDKDPNIKTIYGNALTEEAVDLEELRILKNEIENDKKSRSTVDKQDLFNRFLRQKLEEAFNIHKQAVAAQYKKKYPVQANSMPPKRNTTLMQSMKKLSQNSRRSLTSERNNPIDISRQNSNQKAKNLSEEEQIMQDFNRSNDIIKQVRDFLLRFDDYNYITTNGQIMRQVEKFKNEARKPMKMLKQHLNPDQDLENQDSENKELTKIDIDQMKQQAQRARQSNASTLRRMNGLKLEIQHRTHSFPIKSHSTNLGDLEKDGPSEKIANVKIIKGGNLTNLNEKVGYFHLTNKDEIEEALEDDRKLHNLSRSKSLHAGQSGKQFQRSLDAKYFDSDSNGIQSSDESETPTMKPAKIEIEEVVVDQQKELFEELLEFKTFLALKRTSLEKTNMVNILTLMPGSKRPSITIQHQAPNKSSLQTPNNNNPTKIQGQTNSPSQGLNLPVIDEEQSNMNNADQQSHYQDDFSSSVLLHQLSPNGKDQINNFLGTPMKSLYNQPHIQEVIPEEVSSEIYEDDISSFDMLSPNCRNNILIGSLKKGIILPPELQALYIQQMQIARTPKNNKQIKSPTNQKNQIKPILDSSQKPQIHKAVSFHEVPEVLNEDKKRAQHEMTLTLKNCKTTPLQEYDEMTVKIPQLQENAQQQQQAPTAIVQQSKTMVEVEKVSMSSPVRRSMLFIDPSTIPTSVLRPKPVFHRGPNAQYKKSLMQQAKKANNKKLSVDLRSIANDHPELAHLNDIVEDPNRVKNYNRLLREGRDY